MTILSNKDIIACLGNSVIIEPFNPENVNTSSYDVCLGDWYFIEQKPAWYQRILNLFGLGPVYNIWDKSDVDRVWGSQKCAVPLRMQTNRRYIGINPSDSVIFLPPKTTILAHTVEFIGGRLNVTTMMKARSSYGRNFIEVCKCAGYGDVGYTNRWTMEITNNSKWRKIPLVVNRRIAQIVFMQTGELADASEDYTTTGKYQDRRDVHEWKPEMMLPRLDKDRDIFKGPLQSFQWPAGRSLPSPRSEPKSPAGRVPR